MPRLTADATCHHDEPDGYMAWSQWAAKMARMHEQKRCPVCGLWKVWGPNKIAGAGDAQ